jgi:hypothetical protein
VIRAFAFRRLDRDDNKIYVFLNTRKMKKYQSEGVWIGCMLVFKTRDKFNEFARKASEKRIVEVIE